MTRLTTILAALVLALPGVAFAQGAGDDQYQDPFGDQATAQQGGGGDGDGGGLSDEPQVGGGGSDSGSGGGDAGGSGSAGSGEQPATGTAGAEATAAPADQLPRTGSDPWQLLLLGLAMLLVGVGLRLRTIDPDAY